MGLGQYDSLGKYFGPHTASFVFLIHVLIFGKGENYIIGSIALSVFLLDKSNTMIWEERR